MKKVLNYMYMDKNYFINNLDRAIKEEWIKAYHQPLDALWDGALLSCPGPHSFLWQEIIPLS